MEWRVDRSRHRLDRPPSSCRSLPVQQARLREPGLWSTLTILSLFAAMLMASSGSLVSSASTGQSVVGWKEHNVKNISIRDLSTSRFLTLEHSRLRSRLARNSVWPEHESCRLYRLETRIDALGLGYETDEYVAFNYCSGTCPRTNYDEVLSYISRMGILGEKYKDYVSKACCRPTEFENFSFFDKYNKALTVDKGSAARCGCVG